MTMTLVRSTDFNVTIQAVAIPVTGGPLIVVWRHPVYCNAIPTLAAPDVPLPAAAPRVRWERSFARSPWPAREARPVLPAVAAPRARPRRLPGSEVRRRWRSRWLGRA